MRRSHEEVKRDENLRLFVQERRLGQDDQPAVETTY
jgi:hypothetical protein